MPTCPGDEQHLPWLPPWSSDPTHLPTPPPHPLPTTHTTPSPPLPAPQIGLAARRREDAGVVGMLRSDMPAVTRQLSRQLKQKSVKTKVNSFRGHIPRNLKLR